MRINYALAGQLAVVSIVFFFAWRAFCNWANKVPEIPKLSKTVHDDQTTDEDETLFLFDSPDDRDAWISRHIGRDVQ